MRAIISVYDKQGITEFAKQLQMLGVSLFSTSGTKKKLLEDGLVVKDIASITGFPEILDGRVKTLHPKVHGGILARRDNIEHQSQLQEHHIEYIDIVVCNLYPFEKTISGDTVTLEEALEMIDIGGPTMVRAAAKNFPDVLVIVNPARYTEIIEEWKNEGKISLATRKSLAAEAFQHTAYYDTIVAQYLRGNEAQSYPQQFTLALEKVQSLRYGENPQQSAAFYREGSPQGIAAAQQKQGKELSFNNILDIEAALQFVSRFEKPTISIIKHLNPCGLASASGIGEAFALALGGDPLSAFGGIIGSNREIDKTTAEHITQSFFEVVVAPSFTPEALEIFKIKEKLRVLAISDWDEEVKRRNAMDDMTTSYDYRRVRGGLLVQSYDHITTDMGQLEIVSSRQPSQDEMRDLLFAWKAVASIKSNAIVLAKNECVVGVGAGQMSRVVSAEIAAKKAGESARGSVMASDAFFPFPDGVEVAAKAGITALIQPFGSIRDAEVLEVGERYNLAMVKTNERHFLH